MSALRGYDAWLTRTPWDDMPDFIVPPKCSECGIFMRDDPLWVITVEDGTICKGDIDDNYGSICGLWMPHDAHFAIECGYTVIYRRCKREHLSKEFVI